MRYLLPGETDNALQIEIKRPGAFPRDVFICVGGQHVIWFDGDTNAVVTFEKRLRALGLAPRAATED